MSMVRPESQREEDDLSIKGITHRKKGAAKKSVQSW